MCVCGGVIGGADSCIGAEYDLSADCGGWRCVFVVVVLEVSAEW